jgi:hypothetical protein
MIELFGIAGSDMSGDAIVESEAREQAESARQSLLAVATFFFNGSELWRSGDVERVLRGYRHGASLRFGTTIALA